MTHRTCTNDLASRPGARCDDYVVAMRKAWSGDVVEHKSDIAQLEPLLKELGAPPVEAVERFPNEWLPKLG